VGNRGCKRFPARGKGEERRKWGCVDKVKKAGMRQTIKEGRVFSLKMGFTWRERELKKKKEGGASTDRNQIKNPKGGVDPFYGASRELGSWSFGSQVGEKKKKPTAAS